MLSLGRGTRTIPLMAQAAGERRNVAVLFSDLSGFTSLSEQMDPEDVRDLVDALFRRLRPVIESEGGTVDKFIGDAVMAVFGAPVAHEDDAARSVRAALAMQRELAAFNASTGLDLRMRIGVDFGEVLWSGVAGDRATAQGPAVVAAQKLESAARPGAVLVSPAVHRGCRDAVRFQGPLQVKPKGTSAELAAWEALEGGVEPSRVRAPMVGRDAELAQILGALDAGDGGFVIVEGEAGVGKSKMLGEVEQAFGARHAGAAVARARPPGSSQPPPLAPLGDIARSAAPAAATPAAWAAALAAAIGGGAVESENAAHLILHSIGVAVPGSRVTALEGARLQGEVAVAWEAWLAARAAAGRLLLVLEDLQWADPAAIELLSRLAERLKGRGVAILAAARPGATLPEGFRRFALGDLDRAGVAALASAVLGTPVADDAVDFLLQKTAGHPFYVEELAGFLREERLLDGTPARLVAPPERLPDGLRGLLVARLDSLPAGMREVLKGASVLGRAFWMRLLSRLVEREVETAVAEAGRLALVQSRPDSSLDGDSEFAFRHALLRDAAYGLLTKREKNRLHAQAAGLLEARLPAGGRRVRALAAAHREAAGEGDRAAILWTQAATEALREGPPHEAVALSSEAVRAGGGFDARLVLIESCSRAGRFADAASAARALATESTAPPGIRRRARLAESVARMYRGEFHPGLEAAEDAATLAATPLERMEAVRSRCDLLCWVGRVEEAARDAMEGVREARVLAESGTAVIRPILAGLLSTLGRARGTAGDNRGALAAFEESLAIQEAEGNFLAATKCLANLGTTLARLGENARARVALESVIQRLIALGDHVGVSIVQGSIASVLKDTGNYLEALRMEEESLAIRRRVGDRAGEAVLLGNLGSTWYHLGELKKALEFGHAALALATETGDRGQQISALGNIGLYHEVLGEYAEARRHFELSLALSRELGEARSSVATLHNLGALQAVFHDWDSVEATQAEALELSRQTGHVRGEAISLTNIGALHTARGRHDAALACHRKALEIRERLGDPDGAAQSRAFAAGALADAGRLEEALPEAEAAARGAREGGTRIGLATVLHQLGELRLLAGDAVGARAAAEEARKLRSEVGERHAEAQSVLLLARCLERTGDRVRASELAGESVRVGAALGVPLEAEAREFLARLTLPH